MIVNAPEALDMPLIRRLGASCDLTQADEEALARLIGSPAREFSPRHDLAREGDTGRHVRLVGDGWACRYKSTLEGKRQIVGFILPGDFCDLSAYLLGHMDHSISAITRIRVALITPESLDALITGHPSLANAFWRLELINASMQREWLLSLGQRTAYERIGHLLIELFSRLRAAGLVDGNSCAFPLTQNDLADATGLSPVHVNRTLRELRLQGLVELDRKRLRLPDLATLAEASGFLPNYLHADPKERHVGVYA
ncbi:Crp/Fnr family transcriptional regulator [Sphingomonas arantia]|uniref:Crp/Fnr family transcriptional regulator n=1 Tax=Sphingomonas arantia TaxID=1460676 RepID=A0ABW4TVT9_9SPHN